LKTLHRNEQLESAGSTSWEYDAAGNPAKNAGTTATYNAADELTKAGGPTCTYSEVGQRTKTMPEAGPATSPWRERSG
jgi:hypothetical protein